MAVELTASFVAEITFYVGDVEVSQTVEKEILAKIKSGDYAFGLDNKAIYSLSPYEKIYDVGLDVITSNYSFD